MAPEPDPPFLVVGRILRPHGVRGELFVASLTDREAETFRPGRELRVAGERDLEPDPNLPAFHVEAARPFKKGLLLRFEGVASRTEAEILKDRELLLPFHQAEPLDENELFQHQLLGLSVSTTEGRTVGRVVEFYEVEPA